MIDDEKNKHLPPPEKRKWMSHYWEASITNKGQNPELMTVAALQARVEELSAEIMDRREKGKPHRGLVDELVWRERQVVERGGTLN